MRRCGQGRGALPFLELQSFAMTLQGSQAGNSKLKLSYWGHWWWGSPDIGSMWVGLGDPEVSEISVTKRETEVLLVGGAV